jgi:hypothetical protein
VQLGLQLRQRQIGLLSNPGDYLLLRLNSGMWLAPRIVRHPLALTRALALRRNLLGPTDTHKKAGRQILQ